jgi:hypothetical protein
MYPVNYLQFITIDMIKNWFQNKQKNEQIHDAIVQFLRCRDFIFFVDQVGNFSNKNSMNSKEFQGHLILPTGKILVSCQQTRNVIRIPQEFLAEKSCFFFVCLI